MSTGTRVVLGQGAVALAAVAWALGGWALAAIPVALVLLALTPLPLARCLRRRDLPVGAGPAALLGLIRPGATTSTIDVDGADVGVLEDTDGLAAIIRVGDLSALLGTALPPLPALSSLVPAPRPGVPEVRVQLLISAVTAAAPSPAPSMTSYRQLTDGRVLAHQRVHVAVRVRRAGGFRRADLEQSLLVAVRRVERMLARARLPARPLSELSALAAIAEAAQHDPAHAVRETWSGLRLGGLHQAVFRVRRWPEQGPLMSRLLALPTSVTTLSLAAQPVARSGGALGDGALSGRALSGRALSGRALSGRALGGRALGGGALGGGSGPPADAGGPPVRAELVVRLATPDAATLTQASTALLRLAESMGARVARLDGAQLDGLAATLPLGGGAPRDDAVLAGLVAGRDGLALHGGEPVSVSGPRLAAAAPAIGGEGVMLGVDRSGEPMVVRLFRPEPTRATLIGGARCAQLVILRALATGARVVVQSTRPHEWEPFRRSLGNAESLAMIPPGRVADPPPATATRPQLLVVDVGPVPGRATPMPESAWRSVLFLRDELTGADVDLLTRSDLALLQPLSPREAALAGEALGLGDSRNWLTKIGPEMLAVVVNRQTVRWTHLSTTPIELHLTGGPAR
ncbi:type VII secretion protein EccE [Dactylosporangium sp. CA-139114]|uniref:type VII secretion protein EccE n=1 Tax=Dactylosporangium sp. CA-139114 TaxID=3239931 RepID=UPI003D95A4A3